jgi:hypothetical protein
MSNISTELCALRQAVCKEIEYQNDVLSGTREAIRAQIPDYPSLLKEIAKNPRLIKSILADRPTLHKDLLGDNPSLQEVWLRETEASRAPDGQ